MQFLNLINTVINNVLKYLSSIYNEKNVFLNEIEKYKNEINNLHLLSNKLTKENNDFRSKLINNDYSTIKEDMNNLKENYDKCFQMNQILEKKIKNYETEFELKQMQINSLEEMVKRRSNLNNNLSNNITENNSDDYKPGFYNNNSYNSTSLNDANKTIQKLSIDREKLIQDNMKLIQYNKKLKEQINNLNQIINNLSENNNNNNIENNDENNNDNNENNNDIIDEEKE